LFNEGGGTTATDTSVNNNTLTFNGGAANPTWTNSRSAVA